MPYSIKDIKSEIQKFGKPRFIRAELLKRGYTYHDIARELGVSDTAVKYIIDGNHKSIRIASHIEKLLEVPEGSLFPYVLDAEKSKKKPDKFRNRGRERWQTAFFLTHWFAL